MFQMRFQFKLTLGKFRAEYNKAESRWLNYMGGYVRRSAMNSLKQAKQKTEDDLTNEELGAFIDATRIAEQNGTPKPRLPDWNSVPGKPPLLHMRPSPLKTLLFYAVDMAAADVVVGPVLARSGVANALEFGNAKIRARPFMGPAERVGRARMARKWANAIN